MSAPRPRPLARAALALALGAASLGAQRATPPVSPAPRVTAITHALLIDGRGGPPVADATVVVRGDRIVAAGPGAQVAVPAGATVIDAAGKALLPGLADMHVHLTGGWDGEATDMLGYPRYLDALLAAGITTVHDVGNALPYAQQLKQEVAAGRLRGPRLHIVGALVDGPDPVWPPIAFAMASVEQAPGIVQQLRRAGADHVKAYVGLGERQLQALVRAAAAESLGVIADLGAANGSDWGVRSGIAAYAHAGRRPMSDGTIADMKARGTVNITTLAVLESFARRRLQGLRVLDDPLVRELMPPEFAEALRAFATRPLGPADSAVQRRWDEGFAAARDNVRRLHAAGVPLVAGTDTPYPGVYFGEGLHRELELLVEAGLTPLEAIGTATRNAAAFMRDDTWGTIEPGKRADLLLVDGRPHERISDTRRLALVMQAGTVLPRAELAASARRAGGFRTTGTALSTK